MQNALHNGLSAPAEILRGLVVDLDLSSPAAVLKQQGAVTGTPAFSPNNGGEVELDGTTDYVTYGLNGLELNHANLSLVIEFTPDFATDEDVSRYFFDCPVAGRNFLLKQANAASNTLGIRLGNVSVAEIPEATYSPFWLVGQRNFLVISGTTGATDAWLNGNQILTADASAWTPNAPILFYLGSRFSGDNRFDGTIHSFKVFDALLTADEATAFYENSTYTYREKAVVELPMLMQDHDPGNVRTLDVSGNGNHATLGDGVTPTTYPTKLAKRGYGFDGTDYMNCGDVADFNAATKATVMMAFRQDTVPASETFFQKDVDATHVFSMYTLVDGRLILRVQDGGATAYASRNNYPGDISAGHVTSVVMVYDGDGSTNADKIKLFINGIFLSMSYTGTTPGALPNTAGTDLLIGISRTGVSLFSGQLLDFFATEQVLDPTQVLDLHLSMMRSLNEV